MHPAVSAGQYLRYRQRQQADEQSADGGFDHLVAGQPSRERHGAVEHPRVEISDGRRDDADDQKPADLGWVEGVGGLDETEHRGKPQDRTVDAVGGRRGDEARDKGAVVEILAVDDRGGQHCSAEGCAEDRTDARADTQRYRQPPVGIG